MSKINRVYTQSDVKESHKRCESVKMAREQRDKKSTYETNQTLQNCKRESDTIVTNIRNSFKLIEGGKK